VIRRYCLADGGTVVLHENWLGPDEASRLFSGLLDEVGWRQESILIRGREFVQPRLVAWFGDPGAVYTYSGLTLSPQPWPPLLASLRARVEDQAAMAFNSVLCNLYRQGTDSMGFHADDEPELGPNPVIASVSLGATRRFSLRHTKKARAKLDLDLPGGSLLVMTGTTQHFWRHAVPKQPSVPQSRINLTFRRILEQDAR
jgi:alkylated DNA repair dioxygenase AlkB